jgi:hypothetical protein
MQAPAFLFIGAFLAATAARADMPPPVPNPTLPPCCSTTEPPQTPEIPPLPTPQRPLPPPDCKQGRVYSVESVHVEMHGNILILAAEGTTSTAGWHNSSLRFLRELHPNERDATGVYEFVACRPEIAAEVMTPIAADVPLVGSVATLRHFVIEAQTNAQTLDIDAPPRPR